MTMHGGHEDITMPPPIGLAAGGPEGPYRQDDAPPGDDPVVEQAFVDEREPALPPSRTVPEVLTALRQAPGEFERLISGQSDDALAKPASDGEWGVVEILPHLRDWEDVWQGRIHRLLEEDTPRLEPVDDSLWAIEHDYAGERVPRSLAGFAARRADTVHLLESLDALAWGRTAILPQVGPLTLHQLAERMCDHDARHIEQARDALA